MQNKNLTSRSFLYFSSHFFSVLIFFSAWTLVISTVTSFGATNRLQAEFGRSNEINKQTDGNTSEKTIISEISPAIGFAKLQTGDAVDKGDFYRAGKRKIRLYRSAWKIAVWSKNDQVFDSNTLNVFLGGEPVLEEERSTKTTVVVKAAKRMTPEELDRILKRLRESTQFQRVDPVFLNEETGKEMMVTPRIVVKLKPDASITQIEEINRKFGAQIMGHIHGASDEIIIYLGKAAAEEILNICEVYAQQQNVLWASPDFLFQIDISYTPNDPNFGTQWHLNNTGQSGGKTDADVSASSAWDISTGDSGIVVAIIDTGVDIDHLDLSTNIYINPGETAGNGIDDDGNGYIDDVNGWDFYANDNNPRPGSGQGHGTSCAGIVAARGDNSMGVAGIAYHCRILPVKITSDAGTFASSVGIGNAIRYAADVANLLSNSWVGGGDDSTIHSAIQYAVNTKGRATFFASGNDADGTNSSPAWMLYQLSGFSAGTYTFKWKYTKNPATSSGDDTVWLDDITFSGGATEGFEGVTFPPGGWSTGGDVNWSQYSESKHVRGTGAKSAKAGAITHNQTTYLQTIKTVGAGDLTYYAWVSSQPSVDIFCVEVDSTEYLKNSGVPTVYYDVDYPARYPECIAVGASTDYDHRAQYSQYDETLDHVLSIVTPSDGGNWGIGTTDITGSGGYDPGDYTNPSGSSAFGGTSAACPLAAGVAALLLSKRPDLTPGEIKTILQNTADKVVGVTYVDGYNKYYGYGRINAYEALFSLDSISISVNVSPATWPVGTTSEGAVSATAVDYFTATNNGNVAENFAIITGNSANWTAGDAAGSETFAMKAKGGDIADWTSIRTSQALDSNVATSGTVSFGLQLTTPTTTGYAGSQQLITVTVTASKTP